VSPADISLAVRSTEQDLRCSIRVSGHLKRLGGAALPSASLAPLPPGCFVHQGRVGMHLLGRKGLTAFGAHHDRIEVIAAFAVLMQQRPPACVDHVRVTPVHYCHHDWIEIEPFWVRMYSCRLGASWQPERLPGGGSYSGIERRTGVKFEYVPVLLGGIYKATGNMSRSTRCAESRTSRNTRPGDPALHSPP
jgi:hypothetical protein